MRSCCVLLSLFAVASLCQSASGEDVDQLVGTLRGEDEVARLAARRELADIGPPAVGPLLELVAEEEPRVEQAARQTLRRLVLEWSNTQERRTAVSRPLLDVASGDGDVVGRRLALYLVGMVADEGVTPEVAQLLWDPEVAFQTVRALQYMPHTDPTAALAVALPRAAPDLQVAILDALGARGDVRSASDVAALLDSKSPEVRAGAAAALGLIAAAETLPALLKAAEDQEATVRDAAVDACLKTARRLSQSGETEAARAAYESVLRLARTQAGAVGALTGLGEVGAAESAALIEPFLKRDERTVRVAAVVALAGIPGQDATRAIAGSLRGASPYVVIAGLQALGNRGDAQALSAVRELASDKDTDVRRRAIWALGQLGRADAIPDLKAAIADADLRIKRDALDAYLNLASALARGEGREDARGIYEDVVKSQEREEQWFAALQGLGEMGSADSLPVLGEILGAATGEERESAFAAYFAICAALAAEGRNGPAAKAYGDALAWVPPLAGLAGAELEAAWAKRSTIAAGLEAGGDTEGAKTLYREALETLPADARLTEVALKLQGMGEPVDFARVQGFIRTWWVVGPFPNEDWGAWDKPFPPEAKVDLAAPVIYEGQELRWQEQTTDSHLNLMAPFGGIPQTDEKACYAYARFVVDEAQPVTLKMGSDDGLQVWLNGELIHSNRIDRGTTVDEDVVQGKARAGLNELLCKVYNNFGGWGLILRLCDAQGRALDFTQDVGGGGEAKIPFEKVRLADGAGLVECCTVVDVNGDGKLDIASGGSWYEAPTWTAHAYREMTNDGSYANDWAEFALDANGDGWTDIVSGGFHTEEISWYENPRGEEGMWRKHLAWSRGNEFYETLVMVDVDGDGQGDFVPNAGAPIRWYEVVRKPDAEPEFVRHDIGRDGAGHGIGYGDVNLDGRVDILTPAGWYEAPEDRREGEWTWHPEWKIGSVSVPILAHDVNGDGLADIIWGGGHQYGLLWMEQTREGEARSWRQHTIDASFSQAHAPELGDIDGDGDLDIVVGKRWKAHCGKDPGTDDPLYVYWFEYERDAGEWHRWVVSYGDGAGIGLQQSLVDIDGDGDLDIVSACKTGLYLFLNGLK